MSDIQQAIEEVKTAKATRAYWDDVQTYGSEGQALRALDCQNRQEAIRMLAAVQRVSVYKMGGKVVID